MKKHTFAFIVAGILSQNASIGWAQGGSAPAGRLWSYPDAGAGWVPKTVAVGANGTQVFSEIEYGQDKALLLSGFDTGVAAPVWERMLPQEGANAYVESSELGNVHVSIHQLVLNGNQSTKQPVVSKWSSNSSVPDWTYTGLPITSGQSRVGISRDGQKIVAVSVNPMNAKLAVAIFGPNSGVPQWSGEFTFGTAMRGFDLSSDGSTLYVTSLATAFVWNTITHTLNVAVPLPGSFEAHALSGDGSVFAFGGMNIVDIYERQASGGYLKTYTRNIPGQCVAGKIDISADNSTIAYVMNYYDTNLRVRVEAMDIPTKTVTMFDEATGTGSHQNVCGDIAVSDNGSRFVVGLWGDQGNLVPEVRLYRRHRNNPVLTENLPGSVYDVDISADGSRVAVAAKAVHANVLAGGGQILLYAFDEEDFRAIGVPSLGGSETFELYGGSNSPAFLLVSPQLAANPTVFPNLGTLHLDRDTITILPMGNTDSNGFAATQYPLPSSPSLVGSNLYFQGFYTIPRRLTRDWVRVALLP